MLGSGLVWMIILPGDQPCIGMVLERIRMMKEDYMDRHPETKVTLWCSQ